ncbi:MAG: hypothetical protein KAH23_02790 [Kiritimatiellae bacterium]|nr:hypothetical protein [Kiritimatiellia bacterium]
MTKTITLSMMLASTLVFGASNAALEAKLKALNEQFYNFKKMQTETNEALIEEVANADGEDKTYTNNAYQSVSDMGLAASKVYHSESKVSIGGYGQYQFKKYSGFKNYASSKANQTRNKAETNVVRFVPYFGYKFNDWIVMNTEIEFEDGGSRSDGSKNYKYAIVEFSHLDFLFDEKFNLRVGHVLVPFGNINLNHEPTAFLTSERPLIENYIIPSTWHTNGALLYGKMDSFNYYVGIITSPDAGKFTEGRFIQQGRLGARQFTDDISFVARTRYTVQPGLDVGASVYYGKSTALAEDKPGNASSTIDADVSMGMAEAHVSYKDHGFDIQALAVVGSMGGDYKKLDNVSGLVNGQYLTLGYDVLHTLKTSQKLYAVAEIERLDMDVNSETTYVDNNRFMQYTGGLAYFPDPKVVIKAEYQLKDYANGAKLADENAVVASVGFIF